MSSDNVTAGVVLIIGGGVLFYLWWSGAISAAFDQLSQAVKTPPGGVPRDAAAGS